MRNYWITTIVDGRQTVDATGPRRKDGGFTTKIHVNDSGESRLAVTIDGYADKDGQLRLVIHDHIGDQTIYRRFTR